MRLIHARTFLAGLGIAAATTIVVGCSGSSSNRVSSIHATSSSNSSAGASASARTSTSHAHIPLETIPDHEYTGPLPSNRSSSAQGSTQVRFQAPAESGASFQPISSDSGSLLTQEKRTYFYYPSSEVYFAPDRNMYFWQVSANNWTSGEQLPRSMRLREGEREMINLRTPEPQRYHTKIKRAYPAGGMLTTVDSQH